MKSYIPIIQSIFRHLAKYHDYYIPAIAFGILGFFFSSIFARNAVGIPIEFIRIGTLFGILYGLSEGRRIYRSLFLEK